MGSHPPLLTFPEANTSSKKLAVYGSLKRGEYNHCLLEGSKFLGEKILAGFKMYDLGFYPAVTWTGKLKDKVLTEVYSLAPEVFSFIAEMERGAGYTEELVGDLSIWVMKYSINRPEVAPNEHGVRVWKKTTWSR